MNEIKNSFGWSIFFGLFGQKRSVNPNLKFLVMAAKH